MPSPDSHQSRAAYEDWYARGQAHWELAPGKQVVLAALRRCGALDQPLRVLDIGCGTGDLLAAIQHTVSSQWILHGVDFSSTAVQQAADKYPQHQWDCADATRLSGLADRSLDIVICYGSWEHFDDPLQAIREAGRVLKPGGLVLALLPTLGVYRTDTTTEGFYADLPASTPGGPQQMQWNLTRASWEAMFAAAAVALFNNQLAASCGAQKPDVFFFGMRLNV